MRSVISFSALGEAHLVRDSLVEVSLTAREVLEDAYHDAAIAGMNKAQ